MTTLPPHAGMRHVALYVEDIKAAAAFYIDVLGMSVEWHPDEDNIYLTSGNDNLALHSSDHAPSAQQRLDHIGFILRNIDDVDLWHDHLVAHGVEILAPPKTHRDGARSCYCRAPDGTTVQMIYHPPIANPSD